MTDAAAALPQAPAPAPAKAAGPSKMRKILGAVFRGRVAALVCLVLLVWLQRSDFEFVDTARMRVFDIYHQIKPNDLQGALKAKGASERVVMVVDIDEASLSAIGQWPWSRSTVAKLLENINRYQPPSVGFDIVFPEPDRLSPARLAESLDLKGEALEALKDLPDTDRALAEVLKQSRAVLGQAGYGRELAETGTTPIRTPIAEIGNNPRGWLLNFPSLVRNIPELETAAAGRGMFSVNPESDGVIRRVPAVFAVGKDLYPTLSFEMLRVAYQQQALAVRTGLGGIDSVGIPGIGNVPTDQKGRLLIHFSKWDTERYVSAKDVLLGAPAAEALRGKFVLIGTSAEGLKDIRATPIEGGIPGVEIHAMIIESIFTGTLLSRPAHYVGYEIGVLALGALVIIFLTGVVSARWTLIVFVAIAAGMVGTSWYLFAEQRKLLDASFAVVGCFFIYTMVTYANYAREEAQKKQVREAFGRYISPALVAQLADDPNKLRLGGEMRPMTLMFSDVRGFTTISEQFKTDPQGLTGLINRFLSPTTDVILKNRGTIDKYMGDAIMAFWNAPLDDADHAANACRAALRMFEEMDTLNANLKAEAERDKRTYFPLKVGIGLNSGICCVGNMGSHQRFDYSVLGDTVNLASRLEGQSKSYGVGTVVGENCRKLVNDMAFLELDLIAVKGKKEAVRIFTLLGDKDVFESETFKTLEAKHIEMLAAYRSQQWDKAQALIKECRALGLGMDGFYDVMEERIAEFRANPPPANWDGVYVATSK